MPPTQYTPVDLEGIEQGKFMEAFREAWDKFRYDIVKCQDDEEEATNGHPGKIVGKVCAEIVVEANKGGFIMSTAVSIKMPSKVRTGASTSFQATDSEGRACLFAKVTGTDETHPEQGTLCNDDGSDNAKKAKQKAK